MAQQTSHSRNYDLKMFGSIIRQLAATYLGLTLVGTFIVGLVLGWLILGWVVWPVTWEDAKPSSLSTQYQDVMISYAADSYVLAHTPIEDVAMRLGEGWTKQQVIARIDEMLGAGWPNYARLSALKEALNNYQGNIGPTPALTPATSAATNWPLIIVILLAAALLGAFVVWRLRLALRPAAAEESVAAPAASAAASADATQPIAREVGGARPIDKTTWVGESQKPLAQYLTSYVLGDDRYDMSFSIETGTGDFLGECGVGIGEVVGDGVPDKVTALEVWLFDKNDIRTLTKVLMSEFCFNDAGLKTKLASKGEAVLIKKGDVIPLQTQSLRVQARIVNLVYGEPAANDNAATNSFFKQVDIELAAWNVPA
jgi:hypothetical protein